MADGSSARTSSPTKTPRSWSRQIVRLRWRHRLGPVQIAGRLGVRGLDRHAVLVRCGINRLSHIDRVTGEPLRRYEHDHPVSLIHVDITEFGNIPDGGGHRFVGTAAGQQQPAHANAPGWRRKHDRKPRIGTAFLHTVIDDHSRVAYAEICADEKAATAVGGPGTERWPGSPTAASPSNGCCPTTASAYRSHAWRDACAELGIAPNGPAPTDRRPTARSNASTAPSADGWAYARLYDLRAERATQPCPAGSTSTITTEPTPPSEASHQSPD